MVNLKGCKRGNYRQLEEALSLIRRAEIIVMKYRPTGEAGTVSVTGEELEILHHIEEAFWQGKCASEYIKYRYSTQFYGGEVL